MPFPIDGLKALNPNRGRFRLRKGWLGGQATLKESPATRVRRGEEVEIPEGWRGRTIFAQEIRERKWRAKMKRLDRKHGLKVLAKIARRDEEAHSQGST